MKKYLLIIIYIHVTDGVIYPSVPTHLLECYRSGGPPLGAPRRLDVLLSLLRKLEVNSQLDLRMFSTALLRSFRLDGVEEAANPVETEFVTPYRASAFQFHKYKLLMDLFLPSQDLLEVDEILSPMEKCLLHNIVSSTVRKWERGDENTVCPLSVEQRQNLETLNFNVSSRLHSRCPIEDGVIQTDWGNISPGTVIAAIASVLEAQRVLVTDILNADEFKAGLAEPLMTSDKDVWYANIETLNIEEPQTAGVDISNVWVSTLAGDLAEVVVKQGPRVGSASQRMVIGSNNNWNDTLLPRLFYLYLHNSTFVDWQFTDSEILAGIDGLILANYLPTWIEQRRSLRLSQVLAMYYSNEGVSFEPTVKACNRRTLYKNVVNRTQLLTETSRFALVLSLHQGSVFIPLDELNRISEAAVDAFIRYIPSVMEQYHSDCKISRGVPVMDLVVATDGSWKSYDVEQFMSWVGGALEMDLQRSSLGLLHGNTGQWIAPPSDNLTVVFSHISNFTDSWPNRLNLPNIISRIIRHSQANMSETKSAGPSLMVLIVSPSDRPSSNELERARDLMNTLRTTYFDVYFAYVSEDLTDFQNINNEYLDYSELFITSASTKVRDVIDGVNTYLVKNDIPTRIVGALCPFNGTTYNQVPYEDFVLPSRIRSYRIHPYYLRKQTLINIQFRNDGHGRLLVCTWRGADASHTCQRIIEREIYTFNTSTPCPTEDFCLPMHFTVTAESSSNLCANNDCYLPHQVGYYIQHSGLRCLQLRASAKMVSPWKLYFTLIITISLFFF